MSGKIYVGIGGWTFEPWRGVFYPKGLAQAKELEYAGQHLTAMGSDAEHKNEIAPEILKLADLYVADSASQTRRLGELHHAIDAGLMSADTQVTELGEIIAGKKRGRRTASDITVADLTGTGVQDTAIATLARDRAKAVGAGTVFES